MDEDTKVFRDYLMFTVPNVTVLAGSILGVLMVVGVPVKTSLGIFSAAYGLMLVTLLLIIRPHVSKLPLYRILMAASVTLTAVGIVVLVAGG